MLLRAQQIDEATFRRWSPRRAAEVMQRYGFDLSTDGQLRVRVTGCRGS